MDENMTNWHTDKRFMIALLLAVIPTLMMSTWNTVFLLRALDTNPPIVERLIRLEYQTSEQGRINQLILDELRDAKKDRAKFISEQSRRTSAINWVEKQMGLR